MTYGTNLKFEGHFVSQPRPPPWFPGMQHERTHQISLPFGVAEIIGSAYGGSVDSKNGCDSSTRNAPPILLTALWATSALQLQTPTLISAAVMRNQSRDDVNYRLVKMDRIMLKILVLLHFSPSPTESWSTGLLLSSSTTLPTTQKEQHIEDSLLPNAWHHLIKTFSFYHSIQTPVFFPVSLSCPWSPPATTAAKNEKMNEGKLVKTCISEPGLE